MKALLPGPFLALLRWIAFGDFPTVHVDIRALGIPAQTTAFALARWEGPGVLLDTRSKVVA